MILTQNFRLRLVDRSFDLTSDRNKNIMVLGGPGSGKTRHLCKPALMALNASYFVTDPKGSAISYSEADEIIGRYLIDPAEIGRFERDECLVLIIGLPPYKSKKYDVTKHPRWSELGG